MYGRDQFVGPEMHASGSKVHYIVGEWVKKQIKNLNTFNSLAHTPNLRVC